MRKNYNESNQEQKIKLKMKQRRVRVITLQGVFKKITIVPSQYCKNGNFDDKKKWDAQILFSATLHTPTITHINYLHTHTIIHTSLEFVFKRG